MSRKTLQDWAWELYYWQYQNTNSFYNQLFTLIQKADGTNKKHLEKAFPRAVLIYREWESWPTPEEFFESYDITSGGKQ